MLREQDVIRNELLSRYEKRNEDMTREVSIAQIVVLKKKPEADLEGLCLSMCVFSWSFIRSRTMN